MNGRTDGWMESLENLKQTLDAMPDTSCLHTFFISLIVYSAARGYACALERAVLFICLLWFSVFVDIFWLIFLEQIYLTNSCLVLSVPNFEVVVVITCFN